MHIYIVTYKRPHAQITWEGFSPGLKDRTSLVVAPEEYDEMKKNFPVVLAETNGTGNVGAVRGTVFQLAEGKAHFQADDDIKFFRWKSSDDYHLVRCEPQEVEDLFFALEENIADGYWMSGVSARSGNNNHFPKTWDENARQMRLHAFSEQAISVCSEISRFRCMNDFYCLLSVMTSGGKTKVLNNYALDGSVSNAPGGCSTYRTNEVLTETSNLLREMFPEFVTVVSKKTDWPGMPHRTDVRIQWKKAYESSQRG